jgi:hypothetical protein
MNVMAGNTKEKKELGRPRNMWVNNIKMDVGVQWTGQMCLEIDTGGGL